MQTYFWKLQNNEQDAEVMQKAAALIQAGEVVAFPTETVYGLGAVSYTHLTLPTNVNV